ncbi:uncharacterized protein HD556DRAFT_1441215 [Suillus plorans]|uniref:Uncharacterized protein n=1 Tax=Suillus plorans TaxID=116603 RepID=A0A9P7DKH9_9AGAM|nr:uncharacterized protein HD556DRAFT_1441215 [Suillus plorans]KAG1797050.1 hypothetical protein HD556DRAFT_1441215 [Suillus plorans]
MFYGTDCDEAIPTYVPEDLDGVVRAQMWIGGGHWSCSGDASPRSVSVGGFPGSRYSIFPDAYSVIFFGRGSKLPVNRALASSIVVESAPQWLGDILVVKHAGHDYRLLQSMEFDEKALVDAFLASLSPFLFSPD